MLFHGSRDSILLHGIPPVLRVASDSQEIRILLREDPAEGRRQTNLVGQSYMSSQRRYQWESGGLQSLACVLKKMSCFGSCPSNTLSA